MRCVRCVMDDVSDKTITFDENGVCNYCTTEFERSKKVYFPNDTGKEKLNQLLKEIKNAGKNKKYDCVMGLSGGLDSSYLAYLGHKWGLRILAVHIDDGYDTKISKSNLEKLVTATGFDYEIIKPDSEQFNDLTLSFMKAGVQGIDTPQDNILFAYIYKRMKEEGIKYFLSGGNFALECILQKGNGHTVYDMTYIKDIHARFGNKPIDKLEFLSTKKKYLDVFLRGIKSPRPLNYIDYNRKRAFGELSEFCDFQYYGGKHLENILTAFIQCYWYPKKFGIDKRKSHLSSMIVSGQMTREDALKELSKPLYDEKMMSDYLSYIKKQLGIDDVQFDEIMAAPIHYYYDYKHESGKLLSIARKIYWLFK